MPIVIIEFYDSGVRISDGKNILANSTSCALIETDSSIIIGEQAEHQSHLRPRETSTLFWSELSKQSDTKNSVNNAEIAYRHLEYLWNKANFSTQDIILVTPATLDKHDLGLLLGICKKLSINVAGIVCNATLAMRQPADNCNAIYLDLLQQKLVVTEIIQNTTGLSLKQPSRILNYGLQNFIQSFAKNIANKFISETRFDPLHSAKDEQQFFDKLPLWLSSLNEKDSIECKLSSDDKIFGIHVDNEFLQDANRKLFKEISMHLNVFFHNHESVAIFCSSSCKQVFGLREYLIGLPGCATIQLDENTLAQQALRCCDEIITGEQVHYVKALTWEDNSVRDDLAFTSGRLSNLSSVPSHILINGHAYSLLQSIYIANSSASAEPRIILGRTPDSLCKIFTNHSSVEVQVFDNKQITLNKQRVETMAAVNIGDILNVQGYMLDCQFIKVVGNEA